MTAPVSPTQLAGALHYPDAVLQTEAQRILPYLCDAGTVLAIAPDMEKAAVLREFPDGRSARTAVLDRAVAQAFILQDWIVCRRPGRIAAYEITGVGRAALKRMLRDRSDRGLRRLPRPTLEGRRRVG